MNREKLKSINIFLVSSVFLIIFGIIIYKIFHTQPTYEEQACMMRLNKLALQEKLFFQKYHRYTKTLEELDNGKDHFYYNCPLTGKRYIYKSTDTSFTIECPHHHLIIKNGILYKN